VKRRGENETGSEETKVRFVSSLEKEVIQRGFELLSTTLFNFERYTIGDLDSEIVQAD